MNSRTDLANYLSDVHGDLWSLGEMYVSAVLDEVLLSGHPAWGGDWSAWLGTELPKIIADVVHAMSAAPGVCRGSSAGCSCGAPGCDCR